MNSHRIPQGLVLSFRVFRTVPEKESNPWLVEYVESSLHCNFPGSGTRKYSASCNPTATLGQIPGFRVDLASNDVINAVYAFAFGLDTMLKAYCGKDYHGLCPAFKALPNRNALLYEYIRQVTFEDETGRVFAFSDRRDAATPVAVLHIRKSSDGSGGLQYGQVRNGRRKQDASFLFLAFSGRLVHIVGDLRSNSIPPTRDYEGAPKQNHL